MKALNHELDKLLATIPDEPLASNYTTMRRASSNSLVEMITITCIGLTELDG